MSTSPEEFSPVSGPSPLDSDEGFISDDEIDSVVLAEWDHVLFVELLDVLDPLVLVSIPPPPVEVVILDASVVVGTATPELFVVA